MGKNPGPVVVRCWMLRYLGKKVPFEANIAVGTDVFLEQTKKKKS